MPKFHRIAPPLLLALAFAMLGASAASQDPGSFAPLPVADASAVDLPLSTDGPLAWRPVGDGTALVASDGKLSVGYRRSGRSAYGTAIAFRAGGLAHLETLVVELGDGGRGATLLVSLRSGAGGVHSWSPVRLDGSARTLELDVRRIAPDPFQNAGRDAGEFDPAQAVILSLTDIGGYFGAGSDDVRWSLRAVRAKCGGDAQPGAAVDASRPIGAGAQQFLNALITGDGAADAPLRLLLVDALRRPDDPDAYLWLGLNQLWLAAEGDRGDPRTLEHALLADVWFERHRAAGGRDARLPSWSVPVKLALRNSFGGAFGSGSEAGDAGHAESDLVAPLRAAYAADPGFHGFAIGLIGFDAPTDSRAFRDGLAAVRATFTADRSDPSVQNQPHWPHNVEGFQLFAADYEYKAGDLEAARARLARIEQSPDFASWPFRGEVRRRRETWDRGESIEHGRGWMQAQSCVICHRR